MRESDWQIRWEPMGDSPEVLLDFGDLMENEIARQLAASVAVGRFDFAPSATVATRMNLKRSLEFSRYIEHASAAEAFEACSAKSLAGPWTKGLISLRHNEGGERLMKAALMSSTHEPDLSGPEPRSLHAYRFRVTPQELVPLGDAVTIIGGWYNPPGSGIVINIPSGSGVVPGGTITLPTGIPGVIPGTYPVTGVTPVGGGQDSVEVDVDHDQESIDEPYAVPDFESAHEASPSAGPAYWGQLRGEVEVFTDTPIEVWRAGSGGALGWFPYAAGTWSFLSDDFDDTAPAGLAEWTGLTDIITPRPVEFPGTIATFKWRRSGESGERTLSVPLRGESNVSHNLSVTGVHVFYMPAVALTVIGTASSGSVNGVIEGGGTVQAVDLP